MFKINIARSYLDTSEYKNYKDLSNLKIEYINKIPKILHRTLLFEDEFPKTVRKHFKSFWKYTKDYIKILWRTKDVLEILTDSEKETYLGYIHNIQRADLARYLILKKFGGVYADFDMLLKRPLNELLIKNDKEFLFIEEKNLYDMEPIFQGNTAEYQIRKENLPVEERMECNLRVANNFIASVKDCNVWNPILRLCEERKHIRVNECYDVIFTTGPDIASTFFAKKGHQYENIKMLYRKKDNIDSILLNYRNSPYHSSKNHWTHSFLDF